MVTPELNQYVASQRANGVNDEQLKNTLLQQGWTETDVNEALATRVSTITPTQPSPTGSLQPKTGRPLLIGLLVIIVLAIAGLGYAFYSGTLSLPKSSPTATTLKTQDYTSENKLYSFSYPENWTIKTEEGLVSVESPETASRSDRPGIGEALLTTIPYFASTSDSSTELTSNRSHADQVKDFTTTYAAIRAPEEVTISGLDGYAVSTNDGESKSYNLVLEGDNDIFLIQFLGSDTRDGLTREQKTILESYKVL